VYIENKLQRLNVRILQNWTRERRNEVYHNAVRRVRPQSDDQRKSVRSWGTANGRVIYEIFVFEFAP